MGIVHREVLSHSRRSAHRTNRARSGAALLGCTHCGHLTEGESERKVGHLTDEACPECGYALRVVDLTEAQQLTRERFLSAHWEELAATQRAALAPDAGTKEGGIARFATQQRFPAGFRRPLLQRDEFDSNPSQLRENLRALELLLEDCGAPVRRRILLVFGELVARWQRRYAGEAISVVIEVLEDSVRLSVRNSERHVTPTEWNDVISAPITDLVDAWGMDRRLVGRAWFEFSGGC